MKQGIEMTQVVRLSVVEARENSEGYPDRVVEGVLDALYGQVQESSNVGFRQIEYGINAHKWRLGEEECAEAIAEVKKSLEDAGYTVEIEPLTGFNHHLTHAIKIKW